MGAGNQKLFQKHVAHARDDVQRGNKHLDAGDTALASKAYDDAEAQLLRAQKLQFKGAKRTSATVAATAIEDVRTTLVSARSRLIGSTSDSHSITIPLACRSNGGPMVDKSGANSSSEPHTPSTVDTTGSCRGSLSDAYEHLPPPATTLYSSRNPSEEPLTGHDMYADEGASAWGGFDGEGGTAEYTADAGTAVEGDPYAERGAGTWAGFDAGQGATEYASDAFTTVENDAYAEGDAGARASFDAGQGATEYATEDFTSVGSGTYSDGDLGASTSVHRRETAHEYTASEYATSEYATTEFGVNGTGEDGTELDATSAVARSTGLTKSDGVSSSQDPSSSIKYNASTSQYEQREMVASGAVLSVLERSSALRASGSRSSGQRVTFAPELSVSGGSSTPRSGGSIDVVQPDVGISASNPFGNARNASYGVADDVTTSVASSHGQAGDVLASAGATSMVSGTSAKSRYTAAMSVRSPAQAPDDAASVKASSANRNNQARDVQTSIGATSAVSGGTSKNRYAAANNASHPYTHPMSQKDALTDRTKASGYFGRSSFGDEKSVKLYAAADDTSRPYIQPPSQKDVLTDRTKTSSYFGRSDFGDQKNASRNTQDVKDVTTSSGLSFGAVPAPLPAGARSESGIASDTSEDRSPFAESIKASEQDTATVDRSSSSGNSLWSSDERDASDHSASDSHTHLGDSQNQAFPSIASPREFIPSITLPFDEVFPYRGFAQRGPNPNKHATWVGEPTHAVDGMRDSLPSGMPLGGANYCSASALPRKAAACKENTIKQREQAAFELNPLGHMYDEQAAFTAWLHGRQFPQSGQLEYSVASEPPSHRRPSKKSAWRDVFMPSQEVRESHHSVPSTTGDASRRSLTVSLRNLVQPKTSDEELSDALRQPSSPRSQASQDALNVHVATPDGRRTYNKATIRVVSPSGSRKDPRGFLRDSRSPRFGHSSGELLPEEDKSSHATQHSCDRPLEGEKEQAAPHPCSVSDECPDSGESTRTSSVSAGPTSAPSHGSVVAALRKQCRVRFTRTGTQRDAGCSHPPEAHESSSGESSHIPPEASSHEHTGAPVNHSQVSSVRKRDSRYSSAPTRESRHSSAPARTPRVSSATVDVSRPPFASVDRPRYSPEIAPGDNTVVMGDCRYIRILPRRRPGDPYLALPPYEEPTTQSYAKEPSYAGVAPTAEASSSGPRQPADWDWQTIKQADYQNVAPHPRTVQGGEATDYGTRYTNVAPHRHDADWSRRIGYATDCKNAAPYPRISQWGETTRDGNDYGRVEPYQHAALPKTDTGYGTDYEAAVPYPRMSQRCETTRDESDYEHVGPYQHAALQEARTRYEIDYEDAAPYQHTPQLGDAEGNGLNDENGAPYNYAAMREAEEGYEAHYNDAPPYRYTPPQADAEGNGLDDENGAPYNYAAMREAEEGYEAHYNDAPPYRYTPQQADAEGNGLDDENGASYNYAAMREAEEGYEAHYNDAPPYRYTPQQADAEGNGLDDENGASYNYAATREAEEGYEARYKDAPPYRYTPQQADAAGYGADYGCVGAYKRRPQRDGPARYGELHFQPSAVDNGWQPDAVCDGWAEYERWPQDACDAHVRSEGECWMHGPDTDDDGWERSAAHGGEHKSSRATGDEVGCQDDMYSILKLMRPPQLSALPKTASCAGSAKYTTPASAPPQCHHGQPSCAILSSPACAKCSLSSVACPMSPDARSPTSSTTPWPFSLVKMPGRAQITSPSILPSQMRLGAAALQGQGQRSGTDLPCVHTAMATQAMQKAALHKQSDWTCSMSGLTTKELALARTLRNPCVEWHDIFGYEDIKESLRSHFIRRDDLCAAPGHVSGILLYGPPGVGKTMLAQALGSEIGSTFLAISAAKLSCVSEACDVLNTLFPLAKKMKRVTIFIDDVESIFGSKSTWTTEDNDRIKREFFEGLEAIRCMDARIICATNSPFQLSTAFLRHMAQKIYVPLPALDVRQDMIKFFCTSWACTLEPSVLDVVPKATNGYSSRDLIAVMIRAISCAGGVIDGSKSVYVLLAHFMTALETIQPTVSESMVERFFDWDQQWRNARLCAGRPHTSMSRAQT